MWLFLLGQVLLSGSQVLDLLPVGDSAVFVVSSAGIHLWHGGTLDSLADPAVLKGLPRAIAPVPPDTLWVGTDEGLRLCRGTSERIHTCGAVAMDPVMDLFVRGDTLFLATTAGLVLRTPEREIARLNRAAGLPLLSDTLLVLRLSGDTLLVGTARGLHRVPLFALNQITAWNDTLLTGYPIRDAILFHDTLWIASDSGVWRAGMWIHSESAFHLDTLNDTLLVGAWPEGLYHATSAGLMPLFAGFSGHAAHVFVRTNEGFLWGDHGAWPGLVPEEGGGLWLDTLRSPTGLPFRRATDLVEDRDGNLWGVFWNREGLPDAPSGALWVYLPVEDTLLFTFLPQPLRLAPHPDGGVWVSHYTWSGGGNAGLYRAVVEAGSLRVDSVDVGTRLVMALEAYGDRLYLGFYQGGSSGKFGIRVREADGTVRSLQDNLSEIWRVEAPAVLRVCAGRLWVGTQGQGLLVLDTSGTLVGSVTLPSNVVMDAVCMGDSLLALTDGGLVSVHSDLTTGRTLSLTEPVALDRGLGALWILTRRELLKLSDDFSVTERIPLGTDRLPGTLFESSSLRPLHHPLAVMKTSSRVAVATTRGVVLLSFDNVSSRSPWRIWPHPVQGMSFFLDGPPVDRLYLLSPQGTRIPLRVDRVGGNRLRIVLLVPPSRGPHWLVVEGRGERHTQIVLIRP